MFEGGNSLTSFVRLFLFSVGIGASLVAAQVRDWYQEIILLKVSRTRDYWKSTLVARSRMLMTAAFIGYKLHII